MTVDEFLAWGEEQPGRYELVAGEVAAMAPEQVRHARTSVRRSHTHSRDRSLE
jgi:Uma2 family endonuclease